MTTNITLEEQIKDLRKSVQNNINAFINVKQIKDRWKLFFEDRLQLIHDIMTISEILRMNRKIPFVVPTENGQIAIWLENNTITIEYSDKYYNRKNGYTIAMEAYNTNVIFYKANVKNNYKTDYFGLFYYTWESLYSSTDYESYYSAWEQTSISDKLDLFKEADATFELFSRPYYFDKFIKQFKEYVEEKLAKLGNEGGCK